MADEEGNVSTKKTSSSDTFGADDPRRFDLKTSPEQDVADFGDTTQDIPRHQFFKRTPSSRELQKGVLGISEDSDNKMRLHVKNSKGEIKSLLFA